jgi:hypothetical protein
LDTVPLEALPLVSSELSVSTWMVSSLDESGDCDCDWFWSRATVSEALDRGLRAGVSTYSGCWVFLPRGSVVSCRIDTVIERWSDKKGGSGSRARGEVPGRFPSLGARYCHGRIPSASSFRLCVQPMFCGVIKRAT